MPVAGVYAITASVLWDGNTTGTRQVLIEKDPANVLGNAQTNLTMSWIGNG